MTNRQKTCTVSNIPLLHIPEEIIRKYENHPLALEEGKLLPVYTNQKINEYLKPLLKIARLIKKLTFLLPGTPLQQP